MGVAGAAETTAGERLAERLDSAFAAGDRLRPPENVAKMQSGNPLTDAGQAPGPAAIAAAIGLGPARGTCGVITSSALKRAHRRRILGDSQLAALQPPGPDESTITVAADQAVPRIDARLAGVLSPERSVRLEPASPSTETR